MSQSPLPRPTDAELEILQILWKHGPSTVRDVRAKISEQREVGYTTVLKLLQIMAEKGLVTRNTADRSHVFKAKLRQEQTQRQLVTDLISRAFGGAADELIMQAIMAKKIRKSELSAIRNLLNAMSDEEGGKK